MLIDIKPGSVHELQASLIGGPFFTGYTLKCSLSPEDFSALSKEFTDWDKDLLEKQIEQGHL